MILYDFNYFFLGVFMNMRYKTPLPKGANQKVINLSKKVDKWANIEIALALQRDALEKIEDQVGTNPTFRILFRATQLALEKAEKQYNIALYDMCEAM